MRTKVSLLVVVTAVVAMFALTTAAGADAPKLVAPIYPGAAPAIPAEGTGAGAFYTLTFDGGKTLDCAARKESRGFGNMAISAEEAEATGYLPGPWCFLSRDPIDKVKAFYDKSVGTMHPMQGDNGVHGFAVFAERAWYDAGEEGSGFDYSGVSVHALAPPRPKGQLPASAESEQVKNMYAQTTGYDDYAFYAGTRHFDLFVAGVQAFGFPKKHKPADLDALYNKYGYLESAFFQRKGPDWKPANEPLHAHYSELVSERQTAAYTGQRTAGMQYGMSASQARSVARPDEDATFNRVMQQNPQLANRYVTLTQQVSVLMQQGKFDEAEPLMDEIDELEASNPELAALNEKEQGRQASYQKADQAHDDALQAATDEKLDKAVWGTGMEYLQAVDKEAYQTLIVIDNAFDP
ncbi:MAG: hypothetical protein OEY72_14765, partial [Gammaproteobacteria bacterium]|nr:hypothetical protein [Gammaproteobacteria bacterium]